MHNLTVKELREVKAKIFDLIQVLRWINKHDDLSQFDYTLKAIDKELSIYFDLVYPKNKDLQAKLFN